jgi:hypothetical protein
LVSLAERERFVAFPASLSTLRSLTSFHAVFVTILGIVVCLGGLLANFGRYHRLLLAYVPVQLVFALLNMICFVLWAMVTEIWNWFGAGLAFALIAIITSFGAAIAATQVLTLPQYVSKPSHAASINQTN